MARVRASARLLPSKGAGPGARRRPLVLPLAFVLLLAGCGKGDDDSPDQGAVAPKPNLGNAANAPGGAPQGAKADNGASALAPKRKP